MQVVWRLLRSGQLAEVILDTAVPEIVPLSRMICVCI